jgi:hypothetical protein
MVLKSRFKQIRSQQTQQIMFLINVLRGQITRYPLVGRQAAE